MAVAVVRDRPVPLEHLLRLTTPSGLYEHALGTEPRVANGMCVDDAARALVVVARMPGATPTVMLLAATYLEFLLDGQRAGGLMHNRRTAGRSWVDAPSADDHWGRALWAFGTAAARLGDDALAAAARQGAARALGARSAHPRAMAYAALGAAQLLQVRPEDEAALHLLQDARRALPRMSRDASWPWPEARLSYANAVIPEAMVTVGTRLGDDDLQRDGLRLLRWLVEQQTAGGHLSLVPAGGRAPGDARPGFDQQPIEAAALAEAASTAFLTTGDDGWREVVDACVAWFEGDNDGHVPVRDAETGGGFDGLEPTGVNQNQGAESTLAWLACLQLAQALPAPRPMSPDVAAGDPAWVRRTDLRLRPDPTRVVRTIFLPGQELLASGESRSSAVLGRVLDLGDAEVDAELAGLAASFAHRHRGLEDTWDAHFALMRHRLLGAARLPENRRRLIGAYFTQEYAVEAAALFNPSMVPHPDQSGLPVGSTRFVMTVRAVGDGHLSSMELRTGVIDADESVTLDDAPSVGVLPVARPAVYSREAFEHRLDDLGGDRTNADFVLGGLPPTFGRPDLDRALDELHAQRLTRGAAVRTVDRFEWIADCTYQVEFPPDSAVGERVLMPRGPSERRGLEDVRMVRFTAADAEAEYLGTYTAFDGRDVSMQLLRTRDFARFSAMPLSGPGARNKGLALFPRQVGGRYVAMSRADRESNSVTMSDDLVRWDEPVTVQRPEHAWELVQLGNCGPPIETDRGWLVLTHGVGPMRTYGIGALLLDLDDPLRVLGRLAAPMLTPTADERSGYVPNVVYSCGAMRHGRTLVLPYGCSDSTARIALVDLESLLEELLP